jgi:hypothetical protein
MSCRDAIMVLFQDVVVYLPSGGHDQSSIFVQDSSQFTAFMDSFPLFEDVHIFFLPLSDLLVELSHLDSAHKEGIWKCCDFLIIL